MQSSVTSSSVKSGLNNSAVEPILGSAGLASAMRGTLTLAMVSALLLVAALPAHAQGYGTVFELTPSGNETVLYSFNDNGTDGNVPTAGLVLDTQGNLYGTTIAGGAYGYGTVFELTPSGTETILHSFNDNGTDGCHPYADLVLDTQGNLYGTTVNCGAYGYGTVFELTTSGTETILHSFNDNGTDGYYPYAGLALDTQGNLYGTAFQGGACQYCGIVFKLTPSGTETILHSFGPYKGPDASGPYGGVILDAKGNLYGTTYSGGTHGYGAVFELTPSGTETILYSFKHNGKDGYFPYASLALDKNGNFYGTTARGGGYGGGTLFKVTSSGRERILHSFGNGTDGWYLLAGLALDNNGNLYGTTVCGGTYDAGTAFEVTSKGREKILHSFGNGTDGYEPYGGLVFDPKGNLYGTTTTYPGLCGGEVKPQ